MIGRINDGRGSAYQGKYLDRIDTVFSASLSF